MFESQTYIFYNYLQKGCRHGFVVAREISVAETQNPKVFAQKAFAQLTNRRNADKIVRTASMLFPTGQSFAA
jgi:hypothetical protein